MIDLKHNFMASMPAGFDKPNPGAGMNLEIDYRTGEARGVARTEEQRFATRAAQLYAMAEAGGAAGVMSPPQLDADERVKALAVLTRYGVKTPEKITEALARRGAVETALVPESRQIDVLALPVGDIRDAVRVHVENRHRESFLHTVSKEIRDQAATGAVEAFCGSLSDVLAERKIRAEFDSAARDFVVAFETVSGCRSISDAVVLDETGESVGAWYKALRAVGRMNEIVNLLTVFAAPPKHTAMGSLRRSLEPGEILALSGTAVDTARMLGALNARGLDYQHYFRLPEGESFGVFAAQFEAGCTLALPGNAEDFRDRASEFNPHAAIADAMLSGG